MRSSRTDERDSVPWKASSPSPKIFGATKIKSLSTQFSFRKRRYVSLPPSTNTDAIPIDASSRRTSLTENGPPDTVFNSTIFTPFLFRKFFFRGFRRDAASEIKRAVGAERWEENTLEFRLLRN